MNIRSSDAVYGTGIDTVGTYADAVLFDLLNHQIVSASKSPTIHHCLERSIVQALDDILPIGKRRHKIPLLPLRFLHEKI